MESRNSAALAEPSSLTAVPRWVGYEIFILALCVFAIATLAIHAMVPEGHAVRGILDIADLFVCGIFAVDFVVNLVASKNRLQYLSTWGWIDLLSAMPMLPAARFGRVARVFRIFRLVRGVRASKLLVSLLRSHRSENAFLAASLTALLMLVCCAGAVLHFEAEHPDANIKTAEDAMWWGITTLTTVGYGDRFPVSSEGRLVAAVLMVTGLGLFGTLSGFIAAWFLGPSSGPSSEALGKLSDRIERLSRALEAKHKDP